MMADQQQATDVDPEALKAEIDRVVDTFDQMISSSEHSSLFSQSILVSVTESLRFNQLLKVAVKGSAATFRLTDAHVIGLTETLIKSNIQLVELSLTYHQITDAGLEEIARLLQPGLFGDSQNPGQFLEGLDLEGNEITGTSFPSLNLTSNYDCPLSYLTVSYNPLDQAGRMYLADAIQKNKVLRQVAANNCGFDLNSIVAVTTSLDRNSVLELLYLDRPLLPPAKQEEVQDHLAHSFARSCLSDVSMRQFGILDSGCKLITAALYENMNMISLNLESNRIGVAGAEALASYLITRPSNSLKSLGLSYNIISNDGAIALAEALSTNKALCHLSMKQNRVGERGLSALAKALNINTTLESLSLFGNEFSNSNGKQFFELIKNRLPYTGLNLDVDIYVVDGIFDVAEN